MELEDDGKAGRTLRAATAPATLAPPYPRFPPSKSSSIRSYSLHPSFREDIRTFGRRNEGFLLIAASQGCFAGINTCVKLLGMISPVPVWEVIFVRMLITWLGSMLWMRSKGMEHIFFGPPTIRLLLITRGVTGFAGLYGVYYSLQYLSLSDATMITFLSPVITGIFAFFLLHEPYTQSEALVGVVSFFAVILIAKPSFLFLHSGSELGPSGDPVTVQERTLAIVLAILGVFGGSAAYLAIRKIGNRATALHIIAFFSLYSTVLSGMYPLFFDSPPVFFFDLHFCALLIPIGVLGFLAQTLLTLGLQRELAGRGTLAIYSNIVFAMSFEYLVFGKVVDFISLVGGLMIIAGSTHVALNRSSNVSNPEQA